MEAHPEWKGRSKYGVFGDAVEEMDHRIGKLLQVLKDTMALSEMKPPVL